MSLWADRNVRHWRIRTDRPCPCDRNDVILTFISASHHNCWTKDRSYFQVSMKFFAIFSLLECLFFLISCLNCFHIDIFCGSSFHPIVTSSPSYLGIKCIWNDILSDLRSVRCSVKHLIHHSEALLLMLSQQLLLTGIIFLL